VKITAGILGLIVLLLSVQPAFSSASPDQLMECSTDCCESDAELPLEEDQTADPCSDFCNPFLKCGACAASTIEFLSFNIHALTQEPIKRLVASQKAYCQFARDFWQPPRKA
jgi:hypothetical protein